MVHAQEPASLGDLDREFARFAQEIAGDYRSYLSETDADYRAFVAEVEALWGSYEASTRSTWSSYSSDLHGHGEVNFETGRVRIEVAADASGALAAPALTDALAREVDRLLSDRNPSGRSLLDGQIDTGQQPAPGGGRTREFVVRDLLPRAGSGVLRRGQDARERRVYSVDFSLVPDHLARRAAPYREMVRMNAARFGVDPALVLAVIHTESFFNPLARSATPAYGLMQLVPATGGRDAYAFVHGSPGTPQPAELYDPARNIELGTAYLRLLADREYSSIGNDESRTYLCIAGYNCGPGNVRAAVRRGHGPLQSLSALPSDRIFSILERHTPAETQDYLRKVTQRMKIYGAASGG